MTIIVTAPKPKRLADRGGPKPPLVSVVVTAYSPQDIDRGNRRTPLPPKEQVEWNPRSQQGPRPKPATATAKGRKGNAKC